MLLWGKKQFAVCVCIHPDFHLRHRCLQNWWTTEYVPVITLLNKSARPWQKSIRFISHQWVVLGALSQPESINSSKTNFRIAEHGWAVFFNGAGVAHVCVFYFLLLSKPSSYVGWEIYTLRVKDSELIRVTEESHSCCIIEGNEASPSKTTAAKRLPSFLTFLPFPSLVFLTYLAVLKLVLLTLNYAI